MRILATGATGFIGTSTTLELLKNNHQILGLARNTTSAAKLTNLGAEVLHGDLSGLSLLKEAASKVDGVIHLAFSQDFSRMEQNCVTDRAAIAALAEGLVGTRKPLVVASVTLGLPQGQLGLEGMPLVPEQDGGALNERLKAEVLLQELAREKGAHTSIVRMSPIVHGPGDWAFVPKFIAAARENGGACYIGDGLSCWPSVHRDDAAVLLRLAVERAERGVTYHAVAEEGVATKDIMMQIGRNLKVPVESVSVEEASRRLGFLGPLLTIDQVVSSEQTRRELGWEPTQLGLVADIEANYR